MKTPVVDARIMEDPELLKVMLDNVSDGVYFTNRAREIQYWNKGAERISGFKAEEVVGKRCADNILMHVDDQGRCLCTSALCPLVKCFKGETHHVERVYLHHKEGHRVPVRICAAPIRDKEGEIIGGLETFFDVSHEIAALQELDSLREAALLCPVTGVGNRRYCDETLANQLHSLHADGPGLGVLLFDIDNFKMFNDKYGHHIGDVVLKMVARTVSNELRGFDFVGRWGGEEFLVLLPRMREDALEQTAERIRYLVESSSADVSQHRLTVTISVGATMAKIGEDAKTVVKRADKLMYASKDNGRNCVTVG